MFWEQFWPQLIATIVGIMIGIPVGLWISNYQEESTEEERKGKILRSIKRELEENKKRLLEWKEEIKESGGKSEWIIPYYRTETWRAFSDGGELEWIKDPDLLNELSEAYSTINQFMYYCEKWFEMYQVVYEEDRMPENELKERYDKSINEYIEHSLDAIDKVMELN